MAEICRASAGRSAALMDALTPLVEPLSIDEAFLDLSGTEALHKAHAGRGPRALRQAGRRPRSASPFRSGLSHNKFLAKIASDLDKPRGFAVIGKAETVSFSPAQPVSLIYGVGKVFAETLRQDGFVDHRPAAGDAARGPDAPLRRNRRPARPAGARRGCPRRSSIDGEMKTVSSETTFNTDLSRFRGAFDRAAGALRTAVGAAEGQRNLVGDTVTLKLKSAGFRLRTRARHLMIPTQLANVLYETGMQLLAREIDGTAFRLIGIGLSGLERRRRRRSGRSDRAGSGPQGRGRTGHGPGPRPVRPRCRDPRQALRAGASRAPNATTRRPKKARPNDHPDRKAPRIWLRAAAAQARRSRATFRSPAPATSSTFRARFRPTRTGSCRACSART